MNLRTKTEVVVVKVANGSVAGNVIESKPYTPDKAYTKIIGMAVSLKNPNAEANAGIVDIGLRSNSGANNIFDDADISLYTGASISPNDKFKKMVLSIGSQNLYCRVTPYVNAGADYYVQFAFLLVDEGEVVATAQ